jgi:hypothetical protein
MTTAHGDGAGGSFGLPGAKSDHCDDDIDFAFGKFLRNPSR